MESAVEITNENEELPIADIHDEVSNLSVSNAPKSDDSDKPNESIDPLKYFANIKDRCPEGNTLLVSGYIRTIGSLFCEVPTQLVDICIAFHFTEEEDRFMECGNQYIVFSDDLKTAENMKASWDTCYGKFEIDCNDPMNNDLIFRWTVMIHNHAHMCISIGIDETERKWVNTYPDTQIETVSYRLNADSCPFRNGQRVPTSEMERKGGPNTGDTVEMEFNLKEKTLTYYRTKLKGEIFPEKLKLCQFRAVQTEDVKYCLSIYLWHHGKVTLEEFKVQKSE